MASHSRSRSAVAACSIALLLLPATTTAVMEMGRQMRQPHVEPADGSGYRTYIIQVEKPPRGTTVAAWHHSFLPSNTTALGEPRLWRSYHTVFDGFTARLTEEELNIVSAKPGFVRSFPNVILYPQTTQTPKFLGLPNAMNESPDNWPGVVGGRGVITGVVDGGIYDKHTMLNDAGMDRPPERWSEIGACEGRIVCNNKLIGAKNKVYVLGSKDAPRWRNARARRPTCAPAHSTAQIQKRIMRRPTDRIKKFSAGSCA